MKSLYLLIGETFLADQEAKKLLEALQKKSGELSVQSFYLREISLDEVLVQARTLPFLVEAQCFRIYDADRLKKEDLSSLKAFCAQPSCHTTLVFQAAKVDKRTGFPNAITKLGGEVRSFESQANRSASSRFIREKMRQFGKRMQPQAQSRLEDLAGDMPSFLDSILTQLILYAADAEEITLEMLELFEEELSPVDAFKLLDVIGSGDTASALRLFHRFAEENGKDLLSFVGLLHWQMRRLWKAKVLLEEGSSEQNILKQSRVRHTQARFFLRQLNLLSRQKLETGLENLFQLDWALKSGRAEDRLGLERWIVELTS